MAIPRFSLQENISRNVILVDGITRCGKSLFSNVMSSLKNAEQLQFIVLLEHIVPALSKGAINNEYARSSIRTLMNELAYNMLLSRNVNFRPNDQTSVLSHPSAKMYAQRLTKEDGDNIVTELRNVDHFFPFMTHDMMVNLEYLDVLEMDYKMVHILRHPIDMIHSWVVRGWGERFLNDPRSFTLTIDYNGTNLPWYCDGVEEIWLQLNPMERCVYTVLGLIEKSIYQYKKAKHPDQIYNLTFEDFVQNTQKEMSKICRFIGTEQTFATVNALTNARCPREINHSDRERKTNEFRNGISGELFSRLMDVTERYEGNFYGFDLS